MKDIDEAIERLQRRKEDGGDINDEAGLLRCVYGDRIANEFLARHRIVLDIIRTKRRMGFRLPECASFFREIWPRVEERLSASDMKEIVSEVGRGKSTNAKEQP